MNKKTRSAFEKLLSKVLVSCKSTNSESYKKKLINKARAKFEKIIGNLDEAEFSLDYFSSAVFIRIGQIRLVFQSGDLYYIVPDTSSYIYVKNITSLARLVIEHQRKYAEFLLDDNIQA